LQYRPKAGWKVWLALDGQREGLCTYIKSMPTMKHLRAEGWFDDARTLPTRIAEYMASPPTLRFYLVLKDGDACIRDDVQQQASAGAYPTDMALTKALARKRVRLTQLLGGIFGKSKVGKAEGFRLTFEQHSYKRPVNKATSAMHEANSVKRAQGEVKSQTVSSNVEKMKVKLKMAAAQPEAQHEKQQQQQPHPAPRPQQRASKQHQRQPERRQRGGAPGPSPPPTAPFQVPASTQRARRSSAQAEQEAVDDTHQQEEREVLRSWADNYAKASPAPHSSGPHSSGWSRRSESPSMHSTQSAATEPMAADELAKLKDCSEWRAMQHENDALRGKVIALKQANELLQTQVDAMPDKIQLGLQQEATKWAESIKKLELDLTAATIANTKKDGIIETLREEVKYYREHSH
jgi:hypothetical protein